ncbi:putative uncharacterized protein [Roseburia sp. CAG:309]|nr:putative uncharacterized protein [Roseburia sp. CAG:309]
MRNDHHRHFFCRQFFHHAQDSCRDLRIQCRCRLIKEEHFRMHRKRSGNGNTLILPAGQFTRIGIFFFFQSDFFQEFTRFRKHFFFFPLLIVDRCIGNIFYNGKMRKQVKILEHKSKLLSGFPKFLFTGIICRFHNRFSTVCNVAAVDLLQKCRTAEQCRFSRTGWPNDRNNLAFIYFQADVFQHFFSFETFPDLFHF